MVSSATRVTTVNHHNNHTCHFPRLPQLSDLPLPHQDQQTGDGMAASTLRTPSSSPTLSQPRRQHPHYWSCQCIWSGHQVDLQHKQTGVLITVVVMGLCPSLPPSSTGTETSTFNWGCGFDCGPCLLLVTTRHYHIHHNLSPHP